MVKITVQSRSRLIKPAIFEFDSTKTLDFETLLKEISSKAKTNQNRLRLTYTSPDAKTPKHIAVVDLAAKIDSIDNVDQFYVKDLGPQISWRTVFVLEYLGPLVINPLFYFLFGGFENHTKTQTISMILVVLHFLKREYETIFVHKFSLATMPIFNLFKNSSHYWLLSGFNLGFFLYYPVSAIPNSYLPSFLFHTSNHSDFVNNLFIALWVFAELSNFITHLNLASLRKDPSSKQRRIPFGYGFNMVSVPNYYFEILGWVAFCLINNNPFSYLFLVVGAGQMLIWAIKKHKRYLKDFGDKYPRNRKVIIPYVF